MKTPANNRFSDNPFRDPNLTPEQVARIEARNKALRIYRETRDEGPAIENRCISEEAALIERGTIHIISEIGGCIIDLPPDREGIATSLRSYARRQGMEPMELLDPSIDSLGEWAEMGHFAMGEYRLQGPVLVGTHQGDRVLVGVSKRYGFPGPGASLDDIIRIVRFPD